MGPMPFALFIAVVFGLFVPCGFAHPQTEIHETRGVA